MSGQHLSAMNEEQIPMEKSEEAHSDEKEKAGVKADAEPKQTASFGNYFVRTGLFDMRVLIVAYMQVESSWLCDRKGSNCSCNSIYMLYWIWCGMCPGPGDHSLRKISPPDTSSLCHL